MKIVSYCSLFFSLILPFGSLSQRIDETINSGWLFQKGEVNAVNGVESPDEWTHVNLPHTWNIADVQDEERGYYRGPGWYAKVLRVPAEWKDKRVFIHFEGANQEATVFLNGKPLGYHIGGYTAFRFDLTPYLKFGDENLLTVRVTNERKESIPPLSGDFTIYGGIYRNVRLIVTDPVHFDMDNDASDGVFTVVNRVSHETASVSLKGAVLNQSKLGRAVRLEAQIIDHEQKVVASETVELSMGAGEQSNFQTLEMEIKNPNLWSPDNPYLYCVDVHMTGEYGALLDEITLPLGLRWFEFDAQNRFVLNGEPIKLVGANRHQDLPRKGSALSDEEQRSDYRQIKELGFNFVRLAHYPQAPAVYRACDELGLLVWTENPVVNEITRTEEFTSNCLNMQREHIRQTRNHPSVVFYGYMNEILLRPLKWDIAKEEMDQIGAETLELARKLEALTKAEAPDRKTVMAAHLNEAYNRYGLADVPDVLGWNLYFGWYNGKKEDFGPFLDDQHQRYPDRPLIISEYGPGTDIRNHSETPVPWDFTEDYQIVLHSHYLQQMMSRPFIAGSAAWNFADFGSEGRRDTIHSVNQKGLVTFDRKEKAVCNLYRAWLLDEPVLHIALQNVHKKGGIEDEAAKGTSPHSVKIFSNGNEVELFLNGASLGKKAVDAHLVVFDVPFADGANVLDAVAANGITDKADVDFALYTRPLAAQEPKEIAVNLGASFSFYDPDEKILWMADREYAPGLWGHIGGTRYIKPNVRVPREGLSDNILGTGNDPLFQTFIEGIEGCRFDVQDGWYEVTLCFVELNTDNPEKELIYNLSAGDEVAVKAGARVFGLEINGTRVIDSLNLAREFGPLRAVTMRFRVYAKDQGGIELKFLPIQGEPVLSGIRIKPM